MQIQDLLVRLSSKKNITILLLPLPKCLQAIFSSTGSLSLDFVLTSYKVIPSFVTLSTPLVTGSGGLPIGTVSLFCVI